MVSLCRRILYVRHLITALLIDEFARFRSIDVISSVELCRRCVYGACVHAVSFYLCGTEFIAGIKYQIAIFWLCN